MKKKATGSFTVYAPGADENHHDVEDFHVPLCEAYLKMRHFENLFYEKLEVLENCSEFEFDKSFKEMCEIIQNANHCIPKERDYPMMMINGFPVKSTRANLCPRDYELAASIYQMKSDLLEELCIFVRDHTEYGVIAFVRDENRSYDKRCRRVLCFAYNDGAFESFGSECEFHAPHSVKALIDAGCIIPQRLIPKNDDFIKDGSYFYVWNNRANGYVKIDPQKQRVEGD